MSWLSKATGIDISSKGVKLNSGSLLNLAMNPSMGALGNLSAPNVPKLGALPAIPLPETLAPRRKKTVGDLSALFKYFSGIATTPQGLP